LADVLGLGPVGHILRPTLNQEHRADQTLTEIAAPRADCRLAAPPERLQPTPPDALR